MYYGCMGMLKLLDKNEILQQGRIQDFKLGGALKKKSRRAQKIIFFSNFRGAPGAPPPPYIRPCTVSNLYILNGFLNLGRQNKVMILTLTLGKDLFINLYSSK